MKRGKYLTELEYGDDAADSGGADVGGGVEQFSDGAEALHSGTPAEPVDALLADEDFDLAASFVDQGGGFEGALPGADDDDIFAAEAFNVALIGAMSDELRGQL